MLALHCRNQCLLVLRTVLAAAVILPLMGGCAISRRVEPPRSAWEQILSTEAIDRALAQLKWPDVRGKSILVALGAPKEGSLAASDREYLLRGVQVALADHGGLVVEAIDKADLVLTVLVGAIGIDARGRYFGIKGTSGGFFAFTIPELSLYRRTTRQGFAKTEIALVDHKAGSVVHRSGPFEGSTYRTTTTYFFVFRRATTDTSRLD